MASQFEFDNETLMEMNHELHMELLEKDMIIQRLRARLELVMGATQGLDEELIGT